MSKCRVCREPAIIDLPRHNAHFCAEHLRQLCRRQVDKAIEQFEMLHPRERVLVAVSGGKDSLALWDVLLELGYEVDGVYIGLGIGEYSTDSATYARAFAAARDGGYDVVATGHNLDDEAAVLFGSTLRWNVDALARQLSVLPAGRGFPRKVKPLVRLTERETAAWCVVHGIDYQVEECPLAAGNRHLAHKAMLNVLAATRRAVVDSLTRCSRCGSPTTGDNLCAFCRLVEVASAHEPVPVEMLRPAKARR
jgi:tRNA-5-methyluridine54 2-sulfurtransferase